GQVRAPVVAAGSGVGGRGEPGPGREPVVYRDGQPVRGGGHGGTRGWPGRLDHVEAVPTVVAVGVDGDDQRGVVVVAELGPLVHARPDAVVAAAGQQHRDAASGQDGPGAQRQVPVVGVLGVAVQACRAGCVARLVLPEAGRHELVDDLGVGLVAAV